MQDYIQSIKDEQLESQKNRNCFVFENTPIVLDSCFPSGNLGYANILPFNVIQLKGNPDIGESSSAKYWLYFRIRKVPTNTIVKFILKDANMFRKFLGKDRKNKPYIVYRQQNSQWQSYQGEIILNLLKGDKLDAQFTFQFRSNSNQQLNAYYFALNYPYTLGRLDSYLSQIQKQIPAKQFIYLNVQTFGYSVENRKIYLISLTSVSNIKNFNERQCIFNQNLFPERNSRPYKFKDGVPVILITGRVHPSQVSSSFFIENMINWLLDDSNQFSKILRELFIFYFVPILNPDGVSAGNYRFDNQFRNLNRFYGYSDFKSTPTIKAVEQLIKYLSNKQSTNKIMIYLDVHGHNSPKQSFIFGNYTNCYYHSTENRLFCKLLEKNCLKGYFSFQDSQFSQNHMKIKQKHDHYSKQGSGRVYVGKKVLNDFSGNQNDQDRSQIQHSYTLQVSPYSFVRRLRYTSEPNKEIGNNQRIEIFQYCKQLSKGTLLTILDLLNMNPIQHCDIEQIPLLRERTYHQVERSQKFKLRKINSYLINHKTQRTKQDKQINQIIQKEYFQRWLFDQNLLKKIQKKNLIWREEKVKNFIYKAKVYNFLKTTTESTRVNPPEENYCRTNCDKNQVIIVSAKISKEKSINGINIVNQVNIQYDNDFINKQPRKQAYYQGNSSFKRLKNYLKQINITPYFKQDRKRQFQRVQQAEIKIMRHRTQHIDILQKSLDKRQIKNKEQNKNQKLNHKKMRTQEKNEISILRNDKISQAWGEQFPISKNILTYQTNINIEKSRNKFNSQKLEEKEKKLDKILKLQLVNITGQDNIGLPKIRKQKNKKKPQRAPNYRNFILDPQKYLEDNSQYRKNSLSYSEKKQFIDIIRNNKVLNIQEKYQLSGGKKVNIRNQLKKIEKEHWH